MRGKLELIAIDGPVGVGKSSVARLLAERMGWRHLDTGAMYRAVALLALERGARPDDEAACAKIAKAMKFEFKPGPEGQRVRIDGKDRTEAIRSHETTEAVSAVADLVAVREALGKEQRKMGEGGQAVAEGRDMGTVVFPEARWKFYLDADPRERAKRRGLELKAKGQALSEDELLRSIGERDLRDRRRPVGALRIAEDAVVVDTTGVGLERVVAILESIVREEMKATG